MITRIIPDAVELAPSLEWALDNYPNLVLRPNFMFRVMRMFNAMHRAEIGAGGSEHVVGGPSLQQIEHCLFAKSDDYREPLTFKVSDGRERAPAEIRMFVDFADRSYCGTQTTPLWLIGGELVRASHHGREHPNYDCSPEDALVLITCYEPRQRFGHIIITPFVEKLLEGGLRTI